MNDKEFLTKMWEKIYEKEKAAKLVDYIELLPKKITLKKFLDCLFNEIGIYNLFRNMIDVFFVSYAVTLIIMFGSTQLVLGKVEEIYGLAFIISPILYGSMFVLGCIKEKQQNTLSIQMSCKYTFYHIIALRMVIISILSFVTNYIYVWTLTQKYQIDFARLLILTFLGQVLFSLLLAGTLFAANKFYNLLGVLFGWYLLNGFLCFGIRDIYIQYMENTSLFMLAVILLGVLVLYINFIKKIMEEKIRRNRNAANL